MGDSWLPKGNKSKKKKYAQIVTCFAD